MLARRAKREAKWAAQGYKPRWFLCSCQECCYVRCCRYRFLCCSENRKTRWTWRIIGFLLLLWVVYAIIVGFDLLKFYFDCQGNSNAELSCFQLNRVQVYDLCGVKEEFNGTAATRISYSVDATVRSPSWSVISVKNPSFTASYVPSPPTSISRKFSTFRSTILTENDTRGATLQSQVRKHAIFRYGLQSEL